VDVKLKSVGPLLKSYQEEIDRLTLRSSFAEKAFLALYKPLSELPDPVLGLNRATVRTHRTCPALLSLSLSLCVCVCVVCVVVCVVCACGVCACVLLLRFPLWAELGWASLLAAFTPSPKPG
jgi:hypothetical protein